MNGSVRRIRKPVKREGDERDLMLTLVSFAGSEILIRLFLNLTGYPQVGNGELHIAHVLWGGLLLFASSLLPLLFANRWAYTAGALSAGVGVGLFIDEVGKFITQNNDTSPPQPAQPKVTRPSPRPNSTIFAPHPAHSKTMSPEGSTSAIRTLSHAPSAALPQLRRAGHHTPREHAAPSRGLRGAALSAPGPPALCCKLNRRPQAGTTSSALYLYLIPE